MYNKPIPPVSGTILPISPDDLDERIYQAVRRALQESKPLENPNPVPEWGSRHDATVIAGISLPTLHALISQGLVVARKVGRRTLINLSDLREKLASGEISRYRKHSTNAK